MSKDKEQGTQPKTHVEREHTDESLRLERKKTDDALAVRRRNVENLADDVMERARERANVTLDAARARADRKLDPANPQGGASKEEAGEAVAQGRVDEDVVLKEERASADDTLRRERREQARILAALIPLERERTDRFLLTERGLADDAIIHRDGLMGMVSHALKNLLAAIAIQGRALGKQATDSDEGRRTLSHLDRLERYIACMNRLIGDLVDVTSIDAGKLAVHPKPGDVGEMISEAIAPFAPSAQEKGLSLEFATDGQKLRGIFDWERMVQVVANLIANAMKFSHDGGAITLHAEHAGDDLRVSVLDTGDGIPADMREVIFERFGQVGGTDQAGLGLGLYISKCIVEAQGGRIWAESNPTGVGSAFHLTIPAEGSAGSLK